MSRARLLGRMVGGLLAAVILLVGLGAILHLVGLRSSQPWVRVATVEGESMAPTLRDGERIIFLRLPWREDSIVLAQVEEEVPVVKRVVGTYQGRVLLAGDSRSTSARYQVEPRALLGVMVCRCPPVSRAAARER